MSKNIISKFSERALIGQTDFLDVIGRIFLLITDQNNPTHTFGC